MPLKCELRYDWFTVWRGPINQWAPCNFYCGFVWSFLFLHNNATVKGKQTHSGDAALKRLLHRQNQPDLRPHLRGCQSWWLYRTVWLLRKFSVVVFCWRCKNERVFFKGNVHCQKSVQSLWIFVTSSFYNVSILLLSKYVGVLLNRSQFRKKK